MKKIFLSLTIVLNVNMAYSAQFYCSNGYIKTSPAKHLGWISGGQEECIKAFKDELFCDDGWVKNSSGATLEYIAGGQEECIKAIKGN